MSVCQKRFVNIYVKRILIVRYIQIENEILHPFLYIFKNIM